jgi:hypothetical protein
MSTSLPSPSPKRAAAGRLNRQKRRGLTPEGLERLRQCALANRPWEASTGPRTPEGKAQAACNGKLRQKGEKSTREVASSLAEVMALLEDMAAARQLASEALAGTSTSTSTEGHLDD